MMADSVEFISTPISQVMREKLVSEMLETHLLYVEDDDVDGVIAYFEKEFFSRADGQGYKIDYCNDSDNAPVCDPEEALFSGLNLEDFDMDVGAGNKVFGYRRAFIGGKDSDYPDSLTYSFYKQGKQVAEIEMAPEEGAGAVDFRSAPALEDVLAHWLENQSFPKLPGRCTSLILDGEHKRVEGEGGVGEDELISTLASLIADTFGSEWPDVYGLDSTPFSKGIRDKIISILVDERLDDKNYDDNIDEFEELKSHYAKIFFGSDDARKFRLNYFCGGDIIPFFRPEDAINTSPHSLVMQGEDHLVGLEELETDIGGDVKAFALRTIFLGGEDPPVEPDKLSYKIYTQGKLTAAITLEEDGSTSSSSLLDGPALDEVLAYWQKSRKFPEMPGRCVSLILDGEPTKMEGDPEAETDDSPWDNLFPSDVFR